MLFPLQAQLLLDQSGISNILKDVHCLQIQSVKPCMYMTQNWVHARCFDTGLAILSKAIKSGIMTSHLDI